jgi:hypothetical protein
MTNKEYIVSQLDDIIKALSNIKNSVAESKEGCTVMKSMNGDVPVGKTFEFREKEYIVKEPSRIELDKIMRNVIGSICDLCAFGESDSSLCDQLCCAWFERQEQTDVYFVEKK